jgi:hypothetical protein
MSQHEDSFQLEFEVVNVVTVNISDAARSTQTRQRIGMQRQKNTRGEPMKILRVITVRLRL